MPPVSSVAYLDVAFNPAAGAATDLVTFRVPGSVSSNPIVRFGYGVAGLQVGAVLVPTAEQIFVTQVAYAVTNAADTLVLSTIGFMDVLT